MNSLEKALRSYDGKTAAMLDEIRKSLEGRQGFQAELAELVAHEDARVSDGATWLIKGCLEEGVRLSPSQTEDLIGYLDGISSWPAQLHICQSFRFLEVPGYLADACAGWLTPFLRSERPFLRAWSMDALQHLAVHNPKLAGQARAALDAAGQDPAASVRARARNWRTQPKRR